mgnify:CR=1 FL=1
MAITSLPHRDHTEGTDNMGGIQQTAYYAVRSEFATMYLPYSLTEASSMAQLGTIKQQHVFNAGKGWKRLYNTEDTGSVEAKQQGETDGMSFVNTMTGFFPGISAADAGWFRYMNNTGVVGIGLDAEGLKRQVGNEQYPGHLVDLNVTTTVTGAGRKGSAYAIKAQCPYPAPFYPYTIEEEDESNSD